MSKKLTVEFEDNTYTLEFTRDTAAQLQRAGFDLNKLESQPLIMFPMLFQGAFLANHRNIKKETTDKIYDKVTNKTDMFMKLAEMYNDTVNSLVDDPDDKQGNATWGANW